MGLMTLLRKSPALNTNGVGHEEYPCKEGSVFGDSVNDPCSDYRNVLRVLWERNSNLFRVDLSRLNHIQITWWS